MQTQLLDAASHEEVATGTTGADGTFRCSLDALRPRSVLSRTMHYVVVTAAHPRRGTQWSSLGLPRTTDAKEFASELVFGPTCAVIGRVVDGSGTPVAGAHLHRSRSSEEPLAECQLLSERSGVDGSFCLGVNCGERGPRGGSIVAVHPTWGLGSARLPDAPIQPDTTIDLGAIALDGGDAIRGQVVLGDGSGLGSIEVSVCEISEEMAGDPAAAGQWLQEPYKERQRGLLRLLRGRPELLATEFRTEADGSFTCRGLDHSLPYVVVVRDTFFRPSFAIARPGGPPVRIAVDRQLLLIDVRGGDGQPLRGANIEAMAFDPGSQWTAHAETDRPGFPEGKCVGIARFYPADALGRRMVLSPFGCIWRLRSFDEVALDDWVRHDAFPGVHRAERTLVLQPETRFGALHLEVVDERGAAFPHYGFKLRCLDRRIERNHERLVPPTDGMYRDIPAGRWRLTVGLGQEIPYPPDWPKVRGIEEQEIRIEADRTTKVSIVTRPRGRVAFRVHGEATSGRDLRIRAVAGGAEVPFDTHLPGPFAVHRPGSFEGLLLMSRHGFEPGTHWFEITGSGYRPCRCSAEVAADRINEIDVELVRQ
jgi:hypothetical protein